MTDWGADSEQLRVNLHRVLSGARNDALQRIQPTVETARQWHTDIMRGLTPPGPNRIGRYRGEKGLEGREVVIGSRTGTHSDRVAGELKIFESQLQNMVTALDELIEPDQALSSGDVAAAIDLCAWIHSEWVRIHPFANGNGRMARIWANFIAMRYGLPPFVRLRPRPDGGYGQAAAAAMKGQWQPTIKVFRQLYLDSIRQ
jgi:hypothetical protein